MKSKYLVAMVKRHNDRPMDKIHPKLAAQEMIDFQRFLRRKKASKTFRQSVIADWLLPENPKIMVQRVRAYCDALEQQNFEQTFRDFLAK